MRIDDFLRTHSRGHQLEGGLLGLVINPVLIGFSRGFTDWAGGGEPVDRRALRTHVAAAVKDLAARRFAHLEGPD
jgi:hypothetical protein